MPWQALQVAKRSNEQVLEGKKQRGNPVWPTSTGASRNINQVMGFTFTGDRMGSNVNKDVARRETLKGHITWTRFDHEGPEKCRTVWKCLLFLQSNPSNSVRIGEGVDEPGAGERGGAEQTAGAVQGIGLLECGGRREVDTRDAGQVSPVGSWPWCPVRRKSLTAYSPFHGKGWVVNIGDSSQLSHSLGFLHP